MLNSYCGVCSQRDRSFLEEVGYNGVGLCREHRAHGEDWRGVLLCFEG